jgi:hypothetical protein
MPKDPDEIVHISAEDIARNLAIVRDIRARLDVAITPDVAALFDKHGVDRGHDLGNDAEECMYALIRAAVREYCKRDPLDPGDPDDTLDPNDLMTPVIAHVRSVLFPQEEEGARH